MIVMAREADLSLPELGAYAEGQSLPRMRRWESPFALFQSRLPNTAAVLDCTINPAGFEQRLAQLYPDVLYRWWNPIREGRFAPPFGFPDEAFDRVVCINTLEHLLPSQRDELVASVARKLKPGGLLVLTSDYYFDGAWEHVPFLQLGVMRLDRQEVFNGWNRIRASDWLDLSTRHGLRPLRDEVPEEPAEHDSGLFLSDHAYPHACMGGVFYKPPAPNLARAAKIVLALLTWNTHDVSLDSVRAHVREARLLQRLGFQASVCVCDNGSTDGTADALRRLECEMDVPYAFIFNPTNRGNSVGRNQIIDYARKWDADYLLFIDGDIEVVPFSSVAMLRYMENAGHRLGCIGADSAGHTPLREQATRVYFCISPRSVESTNLVAWTQYGMFRREVFEDGVRFDECDPFDRPGWGFEDNDLAFQMDMRGYVNQRFRGMLYLHRNIRSSIRIMRERGIDPIALYARRKQYIITKWAGVPQIAGGPLRDVRRVELRV